MNAARRADARAASRFRDCTGLPLPVYLLRESGRAGAAEPLEPHREVTSMSLDQRRAQVERLFRARGCRR